MIKNIKKNKKGFTLIEIIVVLVIMGILLAIAIPSILGYVNKANDAKYLAEARGGWLAAQTITADKATTSTGAVTTDITVASVNKELGVSAGEDGAITAITCTLKTGNKNVDSCKVKVAGMGKKYVSFTQNKASIEEGTSTADGEFDASTQP